MHLTMLGTGHAMVTECYNTCFTLQEDGLCFLVDGGGGNGILRQLRHAGITLGSVRTLFVTHRHVDHILGIVWMIRAICHALHQGSYGGDAVVYGHDGVIALLRDMAEKLLQKEETRFIGKRLHLITVRDGEQKTILGRQVTFFDMHSTKTKQFGFRMNLRDGEHLTCCGDEPCPPRAYPYAGNSAWLLHEAFCLHSQADVFAPYEKRHSTVKDACELAARLNVRNLLLYHTEDHDMAHRKERYREEGKQYYAGNLFVPDDLETIPL